MVSVHVTGMSLWGAYSISHVLRHLVLGLDELGVRVTWENKCDRRAEFPSYRGRTEHLRGLPRGPHVQVSWLLPLDATHRLPGCVGHYRWDCSDSWRCYHPGIIEAYNDAAICDKLLLFSRSCQGRFEGQGLGVGRSAVVPLGIDPRVFTPDGPAEWPEVTWLGRHAGRRGRQPQEQVSLEECFTFLTAGYMQARKGVLETVEAFCAEFSGDDSVALVVKQVRRAHGVDQRRLISEILARYPEHPPVAQCSAVLSDWRWAALLRSADCVVNAHRIEGFGMVPLEALACGRPVITTRYGGVLEYATEDNCLLLEPRGEVTEIPDMGTQQAHTKPPQVPVADYAIEDLQGLLRRALDYEQPAGVSSEVRRRWGWTATAARLAEVIEEEGHTVARGFALARPAARSSVSVLIPCRDGAEKLRRTVETVQASTTEPLEVFVFDDASKVPLPSLPGAEVIRSEEWVGAATGRDILSRYATSEWVLFCDADMDFSATRPDWLDVLRVCYQEHDACMVTCKQLRPTGEIDSCGGIINAERHVPGGHLHGGLPGDAPASAVAEALVYASGSLQFLRREDLEQYSYCRVYPATFYEDVDFCYGLRFMTGRAIWYCPEVSVIHDAHGWLGVGGNSRWFQHNEQIFLSRWGDLVAEDIYRLWPGVAIKRRRVEDLRRPRRVLRPMDAAGDVARRQRKRRVGQDGAVRQAAGELRAEGQDPARRRQHERINDTLVRVFGGARDGLRG